MNAPHDRDLTPVDLAAIQSDDALLDELGGADFDAWLARANAVLAKRCAAELDVETALRAVLATARAEVDSEPHGALVDPDTATMVITAARQPTPRRHVLLGPFAAAAVLILALFVLGLLAQGAHPGDLPRPVHELLYGGAR